MQKRDLKSHIFHLNTFSPPKILPDYHDIVISMFGGWNARLGPIFSIEKEVVIFGIILASLSLYLCSFNPYSQGIPTPKAGYVG